MKPKTFVEMLDRCRERIIFNVIKSMLDMLMVKSNRIGRAADLINDVPQPIIELFGRSQRSMEVLKPCFDMSLLFSPRGNVKWSSRSCHCCC